MKKILIIEDDKRIAAALAIRLSAAGYEVLTAFNGLQGLKSAVVQKPALIITDIWMPHPIGFLNRERMHNLGLGSVPVIYITASRKKDLRQIAMEEGAAAFFEKPYDPDELLSCSAKIVAPIPAPSAAELDSETLNCDKRMKNILVVDDDPKIATALAIRLKAAGYGVSTARDGGEGVKFALSSRPDLIVMDVWMPDAVGILVAERLRSLGFADVPIIFLTAGKKEQLWKIAQEVEPAGFFEKPYEVEPLLRAISRILHGRAATNRVSRHEQSPNL